MKEESAQKLREPQQLGLEASSNIVTERQISVFESQKLSTEHKQKSPLSRSDAISSRIDQRLETDPIQRLKKFPFRKVKHRPMSVEAPYRRESKIDQKIAIREVQSVHKQSHETYSVKYDLVASSRANAKEYLKFIKEQSQLHNFS